MDPDPSPHLSLFSVLLVAVDFFAGTAPLVIGATVLAVLLILSGLFSGSEVALFSLTSSARESLSLKEDRASARVLSLLENPRAILVTILILNTVVNVAAAILAAVLTGALASQMGWDPGLTIALEVLVLTFVLLVLSEMSPKLIATRHAPAFSRTVSGPLLFAHRTLAPLSLMLARSTDMFRDRLKRGSRRISSEELKAMADVGEAHGTLEEEERELIYSIVEFGETNVREVMVSRVDMVALPVTASIDDAIELIRSSGHSRIPLFIEHLDNIIGVIYAKDLLPYLGRNGVDHIDWTRMARTPMFVPPGKKLDDLLREFQAKKTHIAIVVDEYGGTAGLVTLEDVLEEIVGEIRDEHDESEPSMYERLDENVYRIDARINLDDLSDDLGIDIDGDQFDFETLGGLIFHLTGSIPVEGEEVVHENLAIRVETVENHRIGKVLVRVLPPSAREEEDDESVRGED
ncbi:MAG: hemolysin family protein [Bacteroidota bacterium]